MTTYALARSGEANSLFWTDIDLERQTITLNTPEKGGKPRIFKVSNKLIAMLNALPKKEHKSIWRQLKLAYKSFIILPFLKGPCQKASKPKVTANKLPYITPLEGYNALPSDKGYSLR